MSDEQLPLESRYGNAGDVGAPYQPGSETSKEAAKAKASRIAEERTDCYRAVIRSGADGLTWDECSAQLGLPIASSGRFTELVEMNLIVRTERRRKTRAGRTAAVHVAAPLAKAVQS